MQKIDRLAAEQEALIPVWRDKYYAAGASTERADRPRAEAAFARAYATIGKEPVPVLWVDSPATAWLFLNKKSSDSLYSSLRDSLRNSLEISLSNSLFSSLWISLWISLRSSLRSSLEISLGDSLRSSLRDQNLYVHTYWWGSYDLYWIAFYKFAQDIIGVKYDPILADRSDIMHEISTSCGWWYPCDGMIVACERPTVTLVDERLRLHNETGPAMAFADGFSIWAVHGVRVPQHVIEKPITLDIIDKENNTEVKRVMIEKFGWDNYAEQSHSKMIDHDDRWGTLMKSPAGLYLRVINRSPEPDGSFRQYILPVADNCEPLPNPNDPNGRMGRPQALTALNAVASTFGMTGSEYVTIIAES